MLKGKALGGAGDLLRSLSLNITAPVTGAPRDIDLESRSMLPAFNAMKKVARQSGERIFIFDTTSCEWKDVSKTLFNVSFKKVTSSGCIEFAIVSGDDRLKDRLSVTLWTQPEAFLQATSPTAPVKRIPADANVLSAAKHQPIILPDPIDAVFTWVNSADPDWQALYRQHAPSADLDRDRFDQTDELKYAIRAIDTFAPWIRTIFVFSNCKPPNWFRQTDRIRWIDHSEVIPADYLPTFNSHAIETFLHRIPGLSEQFIYFNDDFFLNDFVRPTDFFTPYGLSVSRLEPYGAVPYLEALSTDGAAEEWQCAAVNGSRLLSRRFAGRARQLHRHAPYALTKGRFRASGK